MHKGGKYYYFYEHIGAGAYKFYSLQGIKLKEELSIDIGFDGENIMLNGKRVSREKADDAFAAYVKNASVDTVALFSFGNSFGLRDNDLSEVTAYLNDLKTFTAEQTEYLRQCA